MSAPQRPHQFVLTLSCPSAAGQVAAVVGLLDRHRCYVDELTVFDDDLSARFFVRCVFHATDDADSLRVDALRREFEPIAERFRMQWAIHDVAARPKVLIMVSKLEHCLADLLFRWKMGELKMDIVGIASNHPDLEPLAAQHGLPFRHFPITADTKAQQEAQWLDVFETSGAELVILARYMQVLSPETSAKLANRAINIHHSFLPGFKGAKPYHQAHARGVKLIGATAHFVTDDLDEGPIIEQVVERVDHSYRPEQLLAVGRDVECITLARAVKAFIERRVFLNGDRTVVFQ
ncbi:formyltetrahydrofolate deformylase [Burkholderia thailandensis USAMRU Malaysia |uniref:Formyltetrahydrofolate deformylase n=1 Tax=Burkholderia thailandensis (strain ATCC 700388 / DSM 13276 / CCUG 48851 / CIP 106301 / E264) TaxID=271848 RepID=Q2T448_BURTA|nr:formyltetrahydrofolate deformylase [Burkholderia thailandensis]ABC35956.1 formyltetrahydrofolate deformylase [Burkholderia thailandensis E264]AHI76490.1 formyltetrahydrofolate deformylase [Burkholderia thailandensis 2002721723]AHI81400.1 formyltetrahydrofolate deformylase [Burkholderia thailandensis E444]AIC89435.1 formyltetrahydrofolate deformylase [Burkholderia thailandensis USAMRU Malaysia \